MLQAAAAVGRSSVIGHWWKSGVAVDIGKPVAASAIVGMLRWKSCGQQSVRWKVEASWRASAGAIAHSVRKRSRSLNIYVQEDKSESVSGYL